MNPLLVQIIAALVVLITLMMHLLMGYLLWLQCRDVAERDRQREVRIQRLAARRTGRHPR
jgi:phage shock protein PspC (stress-responsive transcriptional regulator)